MSAEQVQVTVQRMVDNRDALRECLYLNDDMGIEPTPEFMQLLAESEERLELFATYWGVDYDA